MRAFILFLLSCLPCFAQFGVEQPMFQSPVASGGSIPIGGLNYYWVFSDAYTNSEGAITNWTDRILGYAMTNTANFPTNTTTGAVFTNGKYLTGPSVISTYSTLWAVITMGNTDVGLHQPLVAEYGQSASALTYWGAWNSGDSGGFTTCGPELVSNVTYDVTFDFLTTANRKSTYTNAVGITAYTNLNYSAFAINTFGTYGTVNRYLYGWKIKELAIYTNTGGLGPSNIAVLHNYATSPADVADSAPIATCQNEGFTPLSANG